LEILALCTQPYQVIRHGELKNNFHRSGFVNIFLVEQVSIPLALPVNYVLVMIMVAKCRNQEIIIYAVPMKHSIQTVLKQNMFIRHTHCKFVVHCRLHLIC